MMPVPLVIVPHHSESQAVNENTRMTKWEIGVNIFFVLVLIWVIIKVIRMKL